MTAIITKTERFIRCPDCNEHEFYVEHIIDMDNMRDYGPWNCHNCNRLVRFEAGMGTVKNIRTQENDWEPCLCLLRFRDVYLVVDWTRPVERESDWYDYLVHSHHCPVNFMRSVVEVYDAENGPDTHGMFRFIASIPKTTETADLIETEPGTLQALFALFGTDGRDAPTNWPEGQRGLLPWIAEMQDAHKASKCVDERYPAFMRLIEQTIESADQNECVQTGMIPKEVLVELRAAVARERGEK